MSVSDRKAPPGPPRDKDTAESTSDVVTRGTPFGSSSRSKAPSRFRNAYAANRLTPYRARLDVEIDDSVFSKVRDPSVSLVCEPSAVFRSYPKRPSTPPRWEALASVALGAVLGALLVVIIVLLTRAL